MSDTEREIALQHLRENQVALSAMVIVGRAPSITEGRVQLSEFIMGLSDPECAHLIFAMTEMLCMKLMEGCDSKEIWFSSLEKSGQLLAIAIAGLEEGAQ